MTIYLNTNIALENYKELIRSKYFVDKSQIIDKFNDLIGTSECHVCITKPRRFGKTSIINMLGAYYTKGYNSKDIFDKLNISKSKSYMENLNKHNVINISLSNLPDKMNSYNDYINGIRKSIINDIKEKYPEINMEKFFSIAHMLSATGEKFIFLIDEWDYIFSHNLFKENQNDFLEFLRNLLKDRPYVDFCYMTGVLPIKKYSESSSLNMFYEYTMLNDYVYDNYFGFTEDEVKGLCEKNKQISFEEISEWYNGYLTEHGERIYNPVSVTYALEDNYCRSYWTRTGRQDEVLIYLKYNIAEVRDDVIEMVLGKTVDIFIDEDFRAGQGAPKTREEIYSAMITYGFLTYYDGTIKIPNKELMQEFESAIKDKSFGYVAELARNSEDILYATLDKDENTIIEKLHNIHNSEIPILQYNDENSLSCVITLAYLAARDDYRVEREEKSGKGYVDFAFHPRIKGDTAFIIELKKDSSPEIAIKQIKEKEYFEKFKKENASSKILAVGICYNSKTKEHECKIEELN
ncbi:MAG: AAA family ATPase [Clostridium sp.]|nr:AAA family ATPase [Clostridium sp.]